MTVLSEFARALSGSENEAVEAMLPAASRTSRLERLDGPSEAEQQSIGTPPTVRWFCENGSTPPLKASADDTAAASASSRLNISVFRCLRPPFRRLWKLR